MNLHEYQGKEMLNSFGVEIQRGIVFKTAKITNVMIIYYLIICFLLIKLSLLTSYYYRKT